MLRPGREVGDVELVDRRRHHQQRHRAHGLRRRPVLDQLEHRRSGRRRRPGVAARSSPDGERVRLDHRGHPRRAWPGRGPSARAPVTALRAAGVDDRLQRQRVEHGHVAGRQRVDEVGRGEADPLVVLPVEVGVLDQLPGGAGRWPGAPASPGAAAGCPSRPGRRTACPSCPARAPSGRRRCRPSSRTSSRGPLRHGRRAGGRARSRTAASCRPAGPAGAAGRARASTSTMSRPMTASAASSGCARGGAAGACSRAGSSAGGLAGSRRGVFGARR